MANEDPTHVSQSWPNGDEDEIAAFYFKGDVPRVGECVMRGPHCFEVKQVHWEMGKVGTIGIRPWARIFLERRRDPK